MLIPFDYLFQKYQIKSESALHLGANTGQEAEAYHKHGIKRVIWVEALPELYHALTRHVAQWPGQAALEACLSDRDGEAVQFHVASNGGQSSSFLEFGTHTAQHPTVRYTRQVQLTTVRVDTLLKKHSIDLGKGGFLNIDLQGAELLALRGMGDLLKNFDHAYIEVNVQELYKGCPMMSEIDAYLARYGFTGVESKMTGAGWGDKYYRR